MRGLRVMAGVAAALAGLLLLGAAALAQQPLEITKGDFTKQKSIDAAQLLVLGVRLGDGKEQALKTLQRVNNITVKEEAASGRVMIYSPAGSTTLVMSLKLVEGQVTAISLLTPFGEWLPGESRALFRAFEDDSLRHKLLGREDQRRVERGGSKEAPAERIEFAYYKEGLLLNLLVSRSADGKTGYAREVMFMFPARQR